MKTKSLGELEELLLLVVARLSPKAYAVSIKDELREAANRRVTLSTVHESLNRLQKKGYLKSEFGEASKVRGGKRKKYFQLTTAGTQIMEETRALRNKMWDGIELSYQKTR